MQRKPVDVLLPPPKQQAQGLDITAGDAREQGLVRQVSLELVGHQFRLRRIPRVFSCEEREVPETGVRGLESGVGRRRTHSAIRLFVNAECQMRNAQDGSGIQHLALALTGFTRHPGVRRPRLTQPSEAAGGGNDFLGRQPRGAQVSHAGIPV